MRPSRLLPLLILTVIAGACSPAPSSSTGLTTSAETEALAPAAEVRFSVTAPPGTSPGADLSMVLLDPATDLDFNTQRVSLEPDGDGHWTATLQPAVGALLYYRYEQSAPDQAIELTALGKPVEYRVVYIPGPGEVHEVIALWSGQENQGETGRLLGQVVSAEDGHPLNEMLVSAGGLLTFTDGEGRFRIDGLASGIHTVTAFSPTGSYRPMKQEAQIAPGATTPATFASEPAERLIVTFQLTVPANTPEEAKVRLAGNVAQMGFRFRRSGNDSYQSTSLMPELVRVDREHFLGVFTLYSGTELVYKYTLGDGVWNAERTQNGAFKTRRVILGGSDPTLRDTVAAWTDGSGESTRFEVAVPSHTPSDDSVSIQFRSGSWRNPLPMWKTDSLWTFALFGPGFLMDDLQYRYCRNLQCGAADELLFAGQNASGRPLDGELRGKLVQDVVEGWQWLDPSALAEEFDPDGSFSQHEINAGVDLANAFDPTWMSQLPAAFADIATMGVDEIVFSPSWVWVQNNPFPVLELDPTGTAFEGELAEIIQLAHDNNLQVVLRPVFGIDDSLDTMWQQGARDRLWWNIWFEQYRSIVLTYAHLAETAGVRKLLLAGPQVAPALPSGKLPDGNSSGAPVDSEIRWRELVDDVRAVYSGQIGFELEFADELSPTPSTLDLFDYVNILWQAPIGEGEADSSSDLREAARDRVISLFTSEGLEDLPTSLSLSFLSLEGSAVTCSRRPDGSCRPTSDFAHGQVVDIDLNVDLEAQAEAYAAVLKALEGLDNIDTVYSRGFYPAVVLLDKSTSIYGKPAEDVFQAWIESQSDNN